MAQFKFDLGQMVEDLVTGFEGSVMARAEYFRSTSRYGVCSRDIRDGKPLDLEWFDEGRLKGLSEGWLNNEVQ